MFPVPKELKRISIIYIKKSQAYYMQTMNTELYQAEAKSFHDYLLTMGLHAKSCRARYLHITEFFCFLESRNIFELLHITSFVVSEFYNILQQRKSKRDGQALSERYIFRVMRCVQEYLGYILSLGKTDINPASHLRFRSRKRSSERQIFTQEEIRELYSAAATFQERAILHIAYGCGLRVSEVSDINAGDVRLTENLVVVRRGKMGKRRLVPISDKISIELGEFIFSDERKKELSDCGFNPEEAAHLFYDNTGGRMQKWTLNKRLKAIIRRTCFGKRLTGDELAKTGIHTLRHSIATHLLENGMKLEQVQAFLGHSQPETTEIYTHVMQHQINRLMSLNS